MYSNQSSYKQENLKEWLQTFFPIGVNPLQIIHNLDSAWRLLGSQQQHQETPTPSFQFGQLTGHLEGWRDDRKRFYLLSNEKENPCGSLNLHPSPTLLCCSHLWRGSQKGTLRSQTRIVGIIHLNSFGDLGHTGIELLMAWVQSTRSQCPRSWRILAVAAEPVWLRSIADNEKCPSVLFLRDFPATLKAQVTGALWPAMYIRSSGSGAKAPLPPSLILRYSSPNTLLPSKQLVPSFWGCDEFQEIYDPNRVRDRPKPFPYFTKNIFTSVTFGNAQIFVATCKPPLNYPLIFSRHWRIMVLGFQSGRWTWSLQWTNLQRSCPNSSTWFCVCGL